MNLHIRNISNINIIRFLTLNILLISLYNSAEAQNADYIPVTVNILKANPGANFVKPEVKFLSDSEGCIILDEDGWTGETPSEFYFTVKIPSENQVAPTVIVDMKGTKVRRVIMPDQPNAEYKTVGNEIKITLVKKQGNIRHLWSDWTDQYRTDIQFPWNWTERRDGPYADPEPLYINRNLAHITYAIGAREVYKEWDITNYLEKNFPGKGDAAAIGYENNFPQQHEDYPPHLHIWFKWPDWRGYNTHLYPDDKGLITSCWIITPKGARSYPKAGEWQEKKDDEERTVFYVRYTETGSIEMQKTKNDPVYSLTISQADVTKLTVHENNKPIRTVHVAAFEPEIARIVIETYDLESGILRTEKLETDRDTAGGIRQIEENKCRKDKVGSGKKKCR